MAKKKTNEQELFLNNPQEAEKENEIIIEYRES